MSHSISTSKEQNLHLYITSNPSVYSELIKKFPAAYYFTYEEVIQHIKDYEEDNYGFDSFEEYLEETVRVASQLDIGEEL